MMLGTGHAWIGPWTQAVLAAGVMLVSGTRFYREAFDAVRGGGANMAVLVSLGTSVAFFASLVEVVRGNTHAHLYFEAAAVVLTLVMLGKYLEARARRGARRALAALGRLQPARGRTGDRRRHADGAGRRRCSPATSFWCGPARASRRWRRSQRQFVGRRIAGHRRKPAGRARRGRHRADRHHQRRGGARSHGDRVGAGHAARPHGAAGRGSADRRRADPAPRRPHLGDLRAGHPCGRGRDLPGLVAGARRSRGRACRDDRRAGHRLPLRARPRDADRAGGRHRLGRARRHPDPRHRDAGTRRQHRDRRLRQDRHADARPAEVAAVHRARRRRDGRCSRLAAAIEAKSEHPLGKALVAHAQPRASTSLPASQRARHLRPGPVGRRRRQDGGGRQRAAGGRPSASAQDIEALSARLGSGGTLAFVLVDGKLVGGLRFSDEARPEAKAAIADLSGRGPAHADADRRQRRRRRTPSARPSASTRSARACCRRRRSRP